MSNIHGLGSSGGGDPGGPPNRPFPGPRSNNNNNNNPNPAPNRQQNAFGLGLGGNIAGASPYPEMNKVLAPNFSRGTFIFWISILQVIVFITELVVGQVVNGAAFCKSNEMGGPSTDTLKIMGGKYAICIQNGEIYRFITPALLHAGILHIFTNLVSQTMIGYTCEHNWGFWRMLCFYFITAFGATLLSTVGQPGSVSVGASGSLLGIIGCYISWIMLNWYNREVLPQPCPRLCTMIWWLVIIFMIGLGMAGIDNFAHLGGLITGIFIGFAFNTYSQPLHFIEGSNGQRIKYVRIIFTLLSIAYFASTLLCTYFVVTCNDCQSCWYTEKQSPSNC